MAAPAGSSVEVARSRAALTSGWRPLPLRAGGGGGVGDALRPRTIVYDSIPIFDVDVNVAAIATVGFAGAAAFTIQQWSRLFFSDEFDYALTGGQYRLEFEKRGGRDPRWAKKMIKAAEEKQKLVRLKEERKVRKLKRAEERKLLLEARERGEEIDEEQWALAGTSAARKLLPKGSGEGSASDGASEVSAPAQAEVGEDAKQAQAAEALDRAVKPRRRRRESGSKAAEDERLLGTVRDATELGRGFEAANELLEDKS